MTKVRFSPGKNGESWAYFIDSRRVIGVNQTGRMILDKMLNQGQGVEQIVQELATEYQLPLEQVKADTKAFLFSVEVELSPEVFNVTPQIQTPFPWGVELGITGKCNLHCLHCLQDGYGYQMPFAEVEKALNILAKTGVFEVSVIGGEPFVHPDIRSILRLCAHHEFAVNIVTNGTLLNEEMIQELAAMRNLAMFVSLEGLNGDHDANRGAGVFAKADWAIRKMVEAGIRVELIFTLMATNIGRYQAVLDYGRGIGIPCNFSLFKPFRPAHQELTPTPEAFFESIVDLFHKRVDGNYDVGLSNSAIISQLLGLAPRNECRAAQSGVVIDAGGRMLPCPSLLFSGYYKGDELPLFDENFVETWRNHPVFTEFRRNGLHGCQARSHIFCGDVTKPDPYGEEAFVAYRAQRGI